MSNKQLRDTVENVKDTANEAMHRSTAEAERARREMLGDEMTTGEKVRSGANEAKNRLEAEGDKAKRAVRDHT